MAQTKVPNQADHTIAPNWSPAHRSWYWKRFKNELGKTKEILLVKAAGDRVVTGVALSRRAYAQYYLSHTGGAELTHSTI